MKRNSIFKLAMVLVFAFGLGLNSFAQLSEANIISINIVNQVDSLIIVEDTITKVIMPQGTNLTALAPIIEISNNATISPESNVAQDFSSPVTYTITSEDGTTIKKWKVSVEEVVKISEIDVDYSKYKIGFKPSAMVSKYYICSSKKGGLEQNAVDFHSTVDSLIAIGTTMFQPFGILCTTDFSHTWKEDMFDSYLVNKIRTVYVVAFGLNNKMYPTIKYDLTIPFPPFGGTGTTSFTFNITNIGDSTAKIETIPNDQVCYYKSGIVTKHFIDSASLNDAANELLASELNPYLYGNGTNDVWNWEKLLPDTEYYAFAIGFNKNQEKGEVSSMYFKTLAKVGIEEENTKNITVFPMPNDGNFTIISDVAGTINIFDLNGKLVFTANANLKSDIITNLSEGVYVLKILSNNNEEVFAKKLVIVK